MENTTNKRVNPIYFLGDIHGGISNLKFEIKQKKLTKCHIIQVGDFGAGFTSNHNQNKIFDDLNKFLKEKKITMLVIRGNHDDPFYFKGRHMFSNLMLLPDYTTMNLNGKNYLFVGGAISIDRNYRLQQDMYSLKKTYWTDEGFNLDEHKLKTIPLPTIDVLVTHSTTLEMKQEMDLFRLLKPEIVDMFRMKYSDDSLLEDLEIENREISKLLKMLPNVKYNFFGHYHNKYESEIHGCKYTLLNIFEFKEFK